MKSSLPKKFMSLRDKSGSHRRSKSSEGHRNRPLSADVFFAYFKSDASKQAAREEEEKEKLVAKVDGIFSRVDELQFHNISKDFIRHALLSRYTQGDEERAIELIRLQQQAFSGILLPYNPNVEMVGAENRSNVTCYLDALLFAMFAKLGAFECMLKNDLPDEAERNLAALIRLWVNMLRSGKLICTDMTEKMQEALAACGWQEARKLEQQDTSEAFAFITETLQLPLLILQVDLFHQGKRDADDHKVVYERLLNLAVPPDPEGKGVKLEDCLEDYFNARVDVLRDRDILEEKKASERKPVPPKNTIRLVPIKDNDPVALTASPISSPNAETSVSALTGTDVTVGGHASAESTDSVTVTTSAAADTAADVNTDTTKGVVTETAMGTATETATDNVTAAVAANTTSPPASLIDPPLTDPAASSVQTLQAERTSESFDRDPAPVKRRWTMLEPYSLVPGGDTTSSRHPANNRQRSATIIQRIVLEDGKPPASTELEASANLLQQFKRQGSTIIKAVTIPAWQFFRLIPWNATSNSEPKSDMEVARQFNKRPVVGICLKRYMMNEAGQFIRHNTYIDIPDSLRLPHFMLTDSGRPPAEGSELNAEYKLVLQSVVCHRGLTLHSGHYISFARVNPKLLTDNRRHESDPPPDYEEEQWVKFDDLAIDNRVTYVDDIKAALKEEMPYLLFYQIVPMADLTASSSETNEVDPPSYNDSTSNVGDARTPNAADTDHLTNNTGSSYFDLSGWGSSTSAPSVRLSSELERPPRISMDAESNTSSSVTGANRRAEGYSRRASLAFVDLTSGITPTTVPSVSHTSAPDATATTGLHTALSLPTAITPTEESTSQRFSRAAARLTGKASTRSRPTSQAGEGRISLTMSRLGGLMRSSKDPLRQSEDGSEFSPGAAFVDALAGNTSTLLPASNQTGAAPPTPAGTVAPILAVGSAGDDSQAAQAAASSSAQQQQQQHHHHHHHAHLRRGKSKSRQEVGAGENATSSDGGGAPNKGKGKEKERGKAQSGMPERECVVM